MLWCEDVKLLRAKLRVNGTFALIFLFFRKNGSHPWINKAKEEAYSSPNRE